MHTATCRAVLPRGQSVRWPVATLEDRAVHTITSRGVPLNPWEFLLGPRQAPGDAPGCCLISRGASDAYFGDHRRARLIRPKLLSSGLLSSKAVLCQRCGVLSILSLSALLRLRAPRRRDGCTRPSKQRTHRCAMQKEVLTRFFSLSLSRCRCRL